MFLRLSRMAALAAALVVAGAGGNGLRAQVFQCTDAVAGQLSEQAGVRCECRFFHASAMAGTPAGYRWDCGILRPRVRPPVFHALHGYYPFFPFHPFVSVQPPIPRAVAFPL